MTTIADYKALAKEYSAAGDRGLAAILLRQARDLGAREAFIQGILSETNGNPVGVELKTKRGNIYAVILEEPDNTGRGRMAMFDEKGFSGHCTYGSPARALDEAVRNGYCVRCDGTIDRLSRTEQWKRGVLTTELIAKVNNGFITMDELQEQMEQFAAPV